MSSVSVGKPAMMSAPNTMSGRSRRTCSVKRIASAREWRRFMRLRIRSSPCCSERCRCGIRRGSSAERIEQVAVGLDRVDRRDAQPLELRHVPQDLPHQRSEPRAAGQVRPVAGDVDAGEHDLAIAVLVQPAHLRDDLAHRHRARIAAAERDDAEGAAMIAAVLDLHEGARVAVDAFDQVKRGLAHRHDVVDDGFLLPRRARTMRQATRAARPRIRGASSRSLPTTSATSGMRREGLRLGLRRAAGDDDLRVRALALEAADRLARLPHGLGGHRAGVDHDRIRRCRRRPPRCGSLPTRRC